MEITAAISANPQLHEDDATDRTKKSSNLLRYCARKIAQADGTFIKKGEDRKLCSSYSKYFDYDGSSNGRARGSDL